MNHTGAGRYATLNEMHAAVTAVLTGSHGRIIPPAGATQEKPVVRVSAGRAPVRPEYVEPAYFAGLAPA